MTHRAYPHNPTNDLDRCNFHVSLDTTSHCNLRCRHCWMDAVRAMGYSFRNEIMPLELFQRIADDFVGRCKSFGVSCGYEPLLNKQFDQYVDYAVKAGLPDVHFYTNGVLMTQDMADRIVAAGPERIVFSLEGATEESFQDIRRGATLEKFTGAIDMINRAKDEQGAKKPVLRLNWVFMPRNLPELMDLAKLAREHRCQEIYFLPHVRWAEADLQEAPITDEEIRAVREQIAAFRARCAEDGIQLMDEMLQMALPTEEPAAPRPAPTPEARREGFRAKITRLLRGHNPADAPQPAAMPYCCQPWELMMISAQGTIFPCTGLLIDRVYGDFKKNTLREIWEGPDYTDMRNGLLGIKDPQDHCQKCPHFALNNRGEDFHKPRQLNVENLRTVTPSIVPQRKKAEA